MKTYKAKASTDGAPYVMTVAPTATPTGLPAVKVTCSCATHAGTSGAAIVATPSGLAFPKSRIHGFVTLAHSPAGRLSARMGTCWKA